MALFSATLPQLQAALLDLIAQAQEVRPTTAAIFQVMYNTGLRVREVLEVDRWQPNDDDTYTVQLEKREGSRIIPIAAIPASIEQRFASGLPFELETYSAVNNTFKYYGPGLLFGADIRRTTCHAFRYQFMKQLSEDGMSVAEVGAVMGHVNMANTASYISAAIRMPA